jgi:myo-inositol-1(or 4)-monophosphatase
MSIELSTLLEAVCLAGKEILSLHKNGFSIERKANNDLLTQADLAANHILKTHLAARFPAIGWLSEESVDDASRLSLSRVWVVDPIDGTIEFVMGVPEYAISVALVENGLPVIAVVFNPVTNELFYAEKGQGAWLNDQKIVCDNAPAKQLSLLASRSEYKRGEWHQFEESHHVKVVGSIAYKLALVAAGKAHATFSLGPKNEWDIAAGVLLVQEAGGIVTTQHQKPFIFNQRNTLVDGIVASSSAAYSQVMSLVS